MEPDMKFWFLLVLSIPATLFCLLIFYYFYRQRKHLSIHHHTTLVLVFLSFLQITTDIPFVMMFYHKNEVAFPTNSFCLWWSWWDYTTSALMIFAMAWGCIERHFLIFYSGLVATPRRRFFFHILPMILVCVYPVIFYLFAIILNTCENQWDYETVLCLQPCYLADQFILTTYDFFFNIVLPIGLILFANGWLIGRIFWQRRHWQQTMSKQRKLTIQLSTVAALYILFWAPLTVNGLIYTFTGSEFALEIQGEYFLFLPYMVVMFLPLVSLPLLPDFRRIICRKRRTDVEAWNTVTVKGITVVPRNTVLAKGVTAVR